MLTWPNIEYMNRRQKMDDREYAEIREKYATGDYSLRKLAAEYDISHEWVRQIVSKDGRAYQKGREEEAEK